MVRRGECMGIGYGSMTVLSGHAVGFSRWVRAGQRSRVRAGRRKGAYGVRLGQIAVDAVIAHSQPASQPSLQESAPGSTDRNERWPPTAPAGLTGAQ